MELINSKKCWGLSSTLTITVLVFLIFSLLQTLVLILCSSDLINYEDVAYMHLGVISTISSIFASIVLILFIRLKNRNIKYYLNLYFPPINTTILFLLISFFVMSLMEYFSNLYPSIFDTDFVIESYKQAKSLPIFYLGVVFFGPIFEEFLFRGFLFKGLQKSIIGGHGAVFVSAILFSIVHVQYGIYILLFMMFPIAVLLGYARLKSGSLLLPILIHMINNLATCLLVHFEIF
tara:strand:+ start:199 stop:900 length:702 start_codon:yes stop_codon:yes gene_type:complete